MYVLNKGDIHFIELITINFNRSNFNKKGNVCPQQEDAHFTKLITNL